MYQLKQMLNDLVYYVYKDDPRLKAYKAFYIEVVDKKYKGRHGDYNHALKRIRLMNTYRDENKLIITSIHELAHHINHMQGNSDIHGKGFYANYEKLLHGTLDMGLVKKEDWLKAKHECRDSRSENKVERIIKAYKPKDSGYKAGKTKFTVYGAYDYKEDLKEKGFTYNKIVKGWEKETDESEYKIIQDYLDGKSLKYIVSGANKYIVKDPEKKEKQNAGKWTLSVQNSYPIKDDLKEHGYRYRKEDYCWCVHYNTDEELQVHLIYLNNLCFHYNIEIECLEMEKYFKRHEVRLILKR